MKFNLLCNSYEFTTLLCSLFYYTAPRCELLVRPSLPASISSSTDPIFCPMSILLAIAQRHVCWLAHVLRRRDNHPTRVFYQFDLHSTDWRWPRNRPRSHWKNVVRQDLQQIFVVGECSDTLSRPWELEGQSSFHGFNSFMVWNLVVAVIFSDDI